ncbi:SseB family protein [Streptomyces sp. VMFN-G11Ma]|uniref:SseB family protein n=1 Tax=Streptomyces sp. VMFN-G11Ma TaxID=2135609 RepID=UPI000D3924F2|nr:SseB family protein [Streptomyces sp. VMFN-G11Ma]PTM85419.1 type III secretion system (T3SS) SseB-like protein [Streptomyces sp. VMFN-G11Ma]
MTEYFPNGDASAVQMALRAVAAGDAQDTELDTLADSEVLVPTGTAPDQPPETVSLPVYEQPDGTELVPVFTSQARMHHAFPAITEHRLIQLGALAHGWPSEKLALVIDAGTPEELALTAQGVKDLLDRGTE